MSNAEICNELWAFDVSAKTWENITVRSDPCIHTNVTLMCGKIICSFTYTGSVNKLSFLVSDILLSVPLRSVGHSATIFTNKSLKAEIMIVIFGYSPVFGFLNSVQEYHFGEIERET